MYTVITRATSYLLKKPALDHLYAAARAGATEVSVVVSCQCEHNDSASVLISPADIISVIEHRAATTTVIPIRTVA
jgi:hypothetical protein